MIILPKNAMLSIASNLELYDKINCTLVCKSWRQWIRNTLLYEKLYFNSNSYNLNRALEFFNTSGHVLGSQTKSLYMFNCVLSHNSILSITRILPNLVKLVWVEANHERSNSTDRGACSLFRLFKWKNLETVYIDAITLNTFEILGIGASLHQLTKLTIDFNGISSKQLLLTSLIPKLKYAETLENLALNRVILGFENMEEIHCNTPCLRTLKLENVELLLMKQRLKNTTIVEANAMRYFRIHIIINTGGIIYKYSNTKEYITQWIEYFGYKYPHVVGIDVHTNLDYLNEPDLNQCVVDLVSKMGSLAFYEIQLSPFTKYISQAMIDNNVQLKAVKIWFKENNVVQQIKALTQITHLESLNVVNKENLSDTSLMTLLELIFHLNLKKLTIKNAPIQLVQEPLIMLLGQHPTLKDIVIDHGQTLDVLVKLKVKKGLYNNSLEINILCYELANHANVSKVIYQIIGKQSHYFTCIRIYGDVFCGFGTIHIPQTKGELLNSLKIKIEGIGKFELYKTKNGSEVWDVMVFKCISKTESDKGVSYHIDPSKTLYNMTDLLVDF